MVCVWSHVPSLLAALIFSLAYFIEGIFISILKSCLERG